MTNKEAIEFLKNVIEQDNKILARGLSTTYLVREKEAYELAIKALELTSMIDKSNFDIAQYKADLQCSYDCGKASVKPCDDCLSRTDLDKALYERFHEEDSPNNITDVRLGSVRDFVMNFPSVTPTQKWISVSEDTPKGMLTKVLVSIEDELGLPLVPEISVYNSVNKTWDCKYKVVAWMSLPEPYKEESEE